MSLRIMRKLGAIAALVMSLAGPIEAQIGYQTPPDAVLKLMDAPDAPYTSLQADNRWLVTTVSDQRITTIADVAEPVIYLAGRSVKPQPSAKIENYGIRSLTLKSLDGKTVIEVPVPQGGRITSPSWSPDFERMALVTISGGRMGLQLFDLATKTSTEVRLEGVSGALSGANWSRDGKTILMNETTPEGVSLWVVDVASASGRRILQNRINHVVSACGWVDGTAPLLCQLIPEGRGAPPEPSRVPSGPIVQESYGRSAPVRTYQNMLKSPHDEALFDYYLTVQPAWVALDGTVEPFGTAAVFGAITPSPNGQYLLVNVIHRPYSYQVGSNAFPTRTEIWDRSGKVIRTIVDRGLRDNVPSARDAVEPGIRQVSWRPLEPATLDLVEALDGGDPSVSVPKRDRVSSLAAPFQGEPQVFVETELRFSGIDWLFPDYALLRERSAAKTRARTWVIDPSKPRGGTPWLLWDLNTEDRYGNPGSIHSRYDQKLNRSVPVRSKEGKYLYLTGQGASPEGDRPFLDRMEMATGKTERLWQSQAPYYESVTDILDQDATRLITSRESVDEPPNIYIRDRATGQLTKLSDRGDPAPFFKDIKIELITYAREDGVQLSATVMLPPGYDKSQGPLPFFLWAYPREFMSADAASQVQGSPYRFKRPGYEDHVLLLAMGYGILDGPTMPIVSKGGKEPNDGYLEQLVASAKAAIDKIVEMGVADRERIGVGGHSYGAFMTANLLAHSNLFKAGIARSGAYNRTLTPFGFQSEPRTFWQARDVYLEMSPFVSADSLKTPILLIHGTHDSNSGTFPVQSERLFAAIKGNGGNVRYVQLPLEDHGYRAIESRKHVVWEMITWLDKYVKNGRAAKR